MTVIDPNIKNPNPIENPKSGVFCNITQPSNIPTSYRVAMLASAVALTMLGIWMFVITRGLELVSTRLYRMGLPVSVLSICCRVESGVAAIFGMNLNERIATFALRHDLVDIYKQHELPSQTQTENNRLLLESCTNASSGMINFLIEKGADVNAEIDGSTVIFKLIASSNRCSLKGLKYIVNKGADLFCERNGDQHILQYACTYGSKEKVEYLLEEAEKIVDAEKKQLYLNEEYFCALLHSAIINRNADNQLNIMRFLIEEKSAKLNIMSDYNMLYHADEIEINLDNLIKNIDNTEFLEMVAEHSVYKDDPNEFKMIANRISKKSLHEYMVKIIENGIDGRECNNKNIMNSECFREICMENFQKAYLVAAAQTGDVTVFRRIYKLYCDSKKDSKTEEISLTESLGVCDPSVCRVALLSGSLELVEYIVGLNDFDKQWFSNCIDDKALRDSICNDDISAYLDELSLSMTHMK